MVRKFVLMFFLFTSFVARAGDLVCADGTTFRILNLGTIGWAKIVSCEPNRSCPTTYGYERSEEYFSQYYVNNVFKISEMTERQFAGFKEMIANDFGEAKLIALTGYAAAGGCLVGAGVGSVAPLIGNGVGCLVSGLGAGGYGAYLAYKHIQTLKVLRRFVMEPKEGPSIEFSGSCEKLDKLLRFYGKKAERFPR